MSMKVSTRQVDGVTILDLSGRITLGEGSVVLRDAIRDQLAKGNKSVLLNLGDVSYIDSSGIAALVEGFQSARARGSRFALVAVSDAVRAVLELARLDRVFLIVADRSAMLG